MEREETRAATILRLFLFFFPCALFIYDFAERVDESRNLPVGLFSEEAGNVGICELPCF